MMLTIPTLPQPVIARVHGVAAAAGCQLVAQCDLAVASDAAKFATRGVNWGFFCATPGVRGRRATCRASTRSRCCSPASSSTPRTALDWGLVNRVVPPAGARMRSSRASCAQRSSRSRRSRRRGGQSAVLQADGADRGHRREQGHHDARHEAEASCGRAKLTPHARPARRRAMDAHFHATKRNRRPHSSERLGSRCAVRVPARHGRRHHSRNARADQGVQGLRRGQGRRTSRSGAARSTR